MSNKSFYGESRRHFIKRTSFLAFAFPWLIATTLLAKRKLTNDSKLQPESLAAVVMVVKVCMKVCRSS